MVTISEAKTQVSQQRNLLEQKRQEISKAEKTLQQMREKLPAVTQRRLRMGTFAGLRGRQRLKAVERAEKAIAEREELVGNYRGDLGKFESERIVPVEQQIKYIETEQAALATAEKLYADRVALAFVSGPEYKYLEQMYNNETMARDALGQQVSDFEAANPGAKLVVDWKRLRVKGVESEAFGQTLPIEQYNIRIEELNKQLKTMPEVKGFLDVSKDVDRTFKVKDVGPLSMVPEYGGDLFPFVSAESDYFLTTGSPIQYASITGGAIRSEQVMTPLPPEMVPGVKDFSFVSTKTGEVIPTTQRDLPDWAERAAFKAGEVIRKHPILSRIEDPSKVGRDIQRVFPKAHEFFTPSISKEFTAFYNPILALATPVKVPTSRIDIPLRGVKTPEVKIIERDIQMFGKPTTLSSYRMVTEIKPPSITVKDVGRGYYGVTDVPKISPAKTVVTTTPIGAIEKLPALTLTTKGAGVGRVDVVFGEAVPITLTQLEKLPKVQQYLWQQYAESVAGRPVALRHVPKILKEEAQSAAGGVQEYKLGKIDISKKPTEVRILEPETLGKRITRYETVSQLEKVRETKLSDVYKGRIFFKDVTKPLARAAGKTPQVKVTLFKMKKPAVEEIGDIQFLRHAGGKKTPLSKTFQKEVTIPKLIPPKPPKIPKTKAIKTTDSIGKYGRSGVLVGLSGRISGWKFTGDAVSDFSRGYFKGMGVSSIKEIGKAEAKTTDYGAGIRMRPIISQLDVIKIRDVQRPVVSSLALTRLLEREKAIPLQIQVPRVRLQERVGLSPRIVPRQVRLFRQITRPRIVRGYVRSPIRPSRTRVSRRTTPPPSPPKLIPKRKARVFGKRKPRKEKVVPFVRRRGKYFAISKPTTLRRALRRGIGELRMTLGASLQVRGARTGKPIPIAKETREFRLGKKGKDVFTLVQRAPKRLGTRQEVAEIIMSRKAGNVKWIK